MNKYPNYYDKLTDKINSLCDKKYYDWSILGYPSIGEAQVEVEDSQGRKFIKYYSLSKKDKIFLSVIRLYNHIEDPMLLFVGN